MSLAVAQFAGEETIKMRQLFIHGTTIGRGGRFPEAFQGFVFQTTSDFFVLNPGEEATASVFARGQGATGNPVILTVRQVGEQVVQLNPANIHGHISFPERTWLRIEQVKAAALPDPHARVRISDHSSLNGWL